MSKQTVIEFMNKVGQSEALQAQVRAAGAKGMAELIAVAAAAGFSFSAEEYAAASADLMKSSGELSDAELNTVAGGGHHHTTRHSCIVWIINGVRYCGN